MPLKNENRNGAEVIFFFDLSLQTTFNCEFLDKYFIFITQFHFDMKSSGTHSSNTAKNSFLKES